MASQAFESSSSLEYSSSLNENETPRIETPPRSIRFPINLFLSVRIDPYEAEMFSYTLIEQATAKSLVEWTPHDDYHISLSGSIEISREQKDSVLEALNKELSAFEERPVSISNSFKGFYNLRGRRVFLAALVSKEDKENFVVPVIDAINRALVLHGLPKYFPDAQPHMSVASAYNDFTTLENDILPSFDSPLQCMPKEEITFNFSHVLCRVGNVEHKLWLRENSGDGKKERYAAIQ